ncbi:MAG TPA: HAMP domain-containing sensor histidine kinase [Candidatus Ozemobacteraceae bacterium]|nr:HAMP domain-containing sensor histidine kinase [Candidatus Ozemobacteraceae bacterium]HQG27030.1 HAMP domain-containing sensor histidine kinase [Candidatus Ozemobacteraceae bacterium]
MIEDANARMESLEKRIRELEAALLDKEQCHVDRMGLFAGGVAHHINNILTSIYGGLSLAASSLADPEHAARYLESTQKAAERAGELTAQLALLARRDQPTRQQVPVGRYLAETLPRVAENEGDIAFEFRIGSEVPDIAIDIYQFEILLKHLVRNSAYAAPNGCRISVTATVTGRPGPEWEREPVERGGDWVEIVFADNGPGIPAQMLGVVFEPYISGHTRGTGLGLPVCRAILKRHGGHITLVSNPGEGVQARILLPAFRR